MIMGRFNRMRSFGDKVTWLLTLTSAVAVTVVSFMLAWVEYDSLRRDALASLDAQTLMVAMNSSAPLAFDDPLNGAEALAAFRARAAVASATMYDVNGQRFATYRRQHEPAPAAIDLLLPGLLARWSNHVTPVEDRGQLLGRIEVVYDLQEIHDHLWRSLLLSVLVSLVVVALVYLVSARISKFLVRPIALLNDTARQVSETKDYKLRARKFGDDELGMFTDTFNQMLDQIDKQNLEIHSSRAEALHASQLKDEFLATLSHELRTPLGPILGWAQILRRIRPDDAQVMQAAEVIERNARAQNNIVEDLLDMSRIVSGKVRLDVQDVDLGPLVTNALDTVALAAAGREVALAQSLPDGPLRTRGDPHRLQQVLWNLLSNAVKFTGAGGTVAVSVLRAEIGLEIRVSDSGQGISSDFLPYVFERFRQADSSTTRQHAGLGLGLSIVKQLVEMHGGSIQALSDGPGLGSTFVVRLREATTAPVKPLASAADRAATARPRPLIGRELSGMKVLLVDDERDARDLITHVLRSAGADVVAVESAVGALAAMRSFRPNALISDIAMPGEDGYDLMRHIRVLSGDEGGNIPAIALTAFARPEDRLRALEAGFQLHVAKPVDEVELLAAVISLVEGNS